MARGTKRKRRDDESRPHSSAPSNHPQSPIESIDLTEVEGSSALAKALAKQREDAVKAQPTEEADTARSMLTAYQCPVCMDSLEDATSTSCGHLFCHKCIVEYLQSIDEQRAEQGKQTKGTCPVCRKTITRNESSGPRRSLIPLKLKVTTKKRRLVSPNKA
ncbi:C3HC4 type (RING finger) zinc finger containing protein [Penicillium brasilianum]|uniref:C3HC4 type (RING finger) zinc finger containing protein n=1 Tax=Penicillium brasilianum TaxID=104259 RepID=A0A1S9RV81_PENBI|nr:C3HC4 type (RING finger) zinc finger containing protein [Penicillium brasilianum]